jgi:D-alanyl-D-alanine carboxypeptidase
LVLETQERGGNRIITVLLGSDITFDADGNRDDATDHRYDDMQAVLDKMAKDYQWIDISRDSDMPGLKDELAAWQVGLDNSDSIVVPRDDNDQVTYLLQLGPETKPEEKAGQVLFFRNAKQVAERTVVQLAPGAQS